MKESWAQWSLKRGVESFPECIAEYLQQSGRVQLHRDAAVAQIQPSASGWKVSDRTFHSWVWAAGSVFHVLPVLLWVWTG